MQMPSTTKCFQTVANPFLRQRGRAPGALSHMVSANLRARALAPIVREIWAAGNMSYNAVSRELNRRQVPTLRGGKKWYPMTAGRLLVRLEQTGLIRIRRQAACSLLELASRESRSTQRRCDRSSSVEELAGRPCCLSIATDPIAAVFVLWAWWFSRASTQVANCARCLRIVKMRLECLGHIRECSKAHILNPFSCT
jgi:hypothetical protein